MRKLQRLFTAVSERIVPGIPNVCAMRKSGALPGLGRLAQNGAAARLAGSGFRRFFLALAPAERRLDAKLAGELQESSQLVPA